MLRDPYRRRVRPMNLTDRDVIALTLYGEARGESTAGRLAVASVLQNRLRDGRWGETYGDVCLARKQFSCWNAGDPNSEMLKALAEQITKGHVPQTDSVLRECYWIAEGLIAGVIRPQVGQALHYHAASMLQPPAWAKTGHVVARLDHHVFYEGVA